MKKETRTVIFDPDLRIEAYRLEGIAQPFPNHFHEHYVLGFIEAGQRRLSCKNREYPLAQGDILLFNPGDNHACAQSDGGSLDYRGFNLSTDVMLGFAEEITGRRELPHFSTPVIFDPEAVCCLRPLHELVLTGAADFRKEERLLLLLSLLIQRYGQPFDPCVPACRQEIEAACDFMAQHFSQRIALAQLCRHAGLSRSTLLRAFTKAKGVTPYRYLENLRINEAKKLLAQGLSPLEAAIQTGFSDQSHFTNYFSSFTGLPPGLYREIFSEKRKGGT